MFQSTMAPFGSKGLAKPVVAPSNTRSPTRASQDSIRIILNDSDQWNKLRLAMRERGARTNMSVMYNLEELLQQRFDDLTLQPERDLVLSPAAHRRFPIGSLRSGRRSKKNINLQSISMHDL